MLAYRHAFHAGNHGDVLKHVALVATLRHLNLKDKPWRALDSHAGAGAYSLASASAQKTGEWIDGIGRLVEPPAAGGFDPGPVPAAVADWLALVTQFNRGGPLKIYPGSPRLMRLLMRPGDELHLIERHPADHTSLRTAFDGDPLARRIRVRMDDGFAAFAASWPPPQRRGLLLIDPSYELKSDYGRTLTMVRDALERFAPGVVMVWLPEVALREAAQLPQRLKAAATHAARPWLHARLSLGEPDARGFGMTGSQLVVVNPPHTLAAALETALPWLAARLAARAEPSWGLQVSPS